MHRREKSRSREVFSATPAYEAAFEAWQRRKWLAVAAFVVVGTGAITASLSLPDLYRATATVLVARQQVSEAFVRPSVTAELETRIHTIHQEIMSRARLTEVITGLNLYPELRTEMPFDAIIERMRRDIELELKGVEQMAGRRATISFAVSYTGRDPQQVAQVANTLADLYVEENTRSREQQASRTAAFLKEQLDTASRELAALEGRASQFRARHTAELPQQLEANLAALERLNTQLRLNGEYQLRAIERRERLEAEIVQARMQPEATIGVPKPVADLAARRQELVQLRRQYREQHPDVIRVKAEVATLEQQVAALDATGTGGPAPEDPRERLQHAREQVDVELTSLKQEERFLRQAIASYEGRVENAPRRQQELQDLSRDQETTKERHDALLRQYEAAQLAATLEEGQKIEQFRVLDPALPPARPSAPSRLWLLAMGLIAATGLGFGAIVAAEKLDTSFHAAEDLRSFAGVPAASIRSIETDADVRRQRLRFALLIAALVAGLGLVSAGSYYVAANNEQLVRMATRGRG